MWEGMFSLLQLNFTAEVAPLPRMVVPGGEGGEGEGGAQEEDGQVETT